MEDEILFWAGIRRHKGSLFGVAALLFLAACSLCTVLTVYLKGNGYIRQEMRRAGFGSLTAWVSDVPDVEGLAETIRQQEGVAKTRAQRLIYTEYEGNGVESDSEGQLIPWSAKDERYKFIRDDLSGYKEAPEEILPGEVFASPSMASVMGLKIGDTITFLVARGGRDVSLTVAGYYEDPFMGSAMIGMKGFLISQRDYQRVREIIRAEGMNALARDGAMLHIAMASQAGYTISDLSRALNEDTPLSMYTEFIHSADAISGFMTILQNAFCGLLAAFAIVLLVVAFLALGHSISGMVEQDFRDFGILKTVGMTGKRLVRLQAMQYGASAAVGLLSGILVAIPASRAVSRITVTSSGFLIPTGILVLPCLGVFAGLLALLLGFTVLRLWRVHDIAPLDAIRGQARVGGGDFYHFHSIRARGLSFQLALRQLLWGKRRYVSSCMVAALLVFFASLVGRMDGWLGPDGKGMMDAFNPADLDLGVQVLGDLEAEEMERVVASYSDITDSYLLAMPDVFLSVPNAVASAGMGASNYTANVISEPDRFHVSRGADQREFG